MAAAEAAKNTVEQFTAASNVAFKEGVEKSLSAMNELNAHSKKNLEAIVASATASAKGAEALGAQAMAFSKAVFDTQVSAAKSLAGAKSVQEVVELQTSFAKTALETYMAEFAKMSDTVSASVKESMKPLNERVTATVEKFQAVR
jgi:phasin family protein